MKVILLLLLAAVGGDWSQFRGPKRDGLSTETNLLKRWPDSGPKLIWRAKGIGEGFATVSVSDGMIYTAGNIAADTVITALDLSGGVKWQTSNGKSYKQGRLSGSRGTPTVVGTRLYHESPHGDVACLDAKSGKTIWSLNMFKKFGGRQITWAVSESLLVDAGKVICCPGGPDAGMVALDAKTGRTIWICKQLSDKPAYASPIVFDFAGVRQIVTMTFSAAVGVSAETGRLLWRFEHGNPRGTNVPTPIHHAGWVFINSGAGTGGRLLKLQPDGEKFAVKQVWRTKDMDNHHGGVVRVDGHLYGSTHKLNPSRWVCLDFKTGRATHVARGVGKGSLTCADGMLYTLSERGEMGLVQAAPGAHEVVSRFPIPKGGRGPVWAHPVVCGGRLYIRHGEFLYAYNIQAKPN